MSSSAGSPVSIDEKQNIPAGIGLMLFGFLLFSANDALGKWMAATYAPGQILLIRNTASLALLVPFIVKSGIRPLFTLERPWLQVLRLVFATTEVLFFYWAVSGLPLADAMTYYLAGPIYVTVLAAFVLKEHVGWRRWSAVGVGFIGVLIAMEPSAGVFNFHALVAFTGSLLYAGFLVVTRRLRNTPDLNAGGLAGGVGTGRRGNRRPVQLGPGRPQHRLPAAGGARHNRAGGDRGRQPLAQARTGLDRGALSVHADHLGGAVRLSRLR